MIKIREQSLRKLSLTSELVAHCHRDVADSGPDPTQVMLDDVGRVAFVERLLSEKPEGPFWLFAYGSLIWKPEFPTVETRKAIAHNWHRAFSMRIKRHRGTTEQPGLMMCLDPGGVCEGVVLRLSDEGLREQLIQLLQREISRVAALDAIRWIEVETPEGQVRALAFYTKPEMLDGYEANLPLPEVAAILARACGHWGSGAEYLFKTVSNLEAIGVHDENLWTLQELVAQEIRTLHVPAS